MDKLHKIKLVTNFFQQKFKVCLMEKDIAIDELLMKFKERIL